MSGRDLVAFDRDLRLLARDPWFREGIGIVLNLSPNQVAALLTQTSADFEARADAEVTVGLDPRDYRFALAALEYIYTKAREKGITPQEAAKTLIEIAVDSSSTAGQKDEDELLPSLTRLLEPRPTFEFHRAQAHVLKVLAAVSLALDLRAVETTPDELPLFVPVILARLEFDEGPPTVFQIPESIYSDLVDELTHYRRLLVQTTDQLSEKILDKEQWTGQG